MSMLKCPNPTCPYLFNPTGVPAGVMLACPRCNMRFTLGPPSAPPAPLPPGMTHPGTAPTATFPGAPLTGYPPPPPAPLGNLPAAPASAPSESPRVQVRMPVHGSPLQTALLVLVTVVALAGAGVAVWYKLTHTSQREPDNSAQVLKDLNLSLEPPPSPWTRDDEMKNKLGSPYRLVYRRDNPEAFIAFGAKDYDPRSPRPSELRGGLTEALAILLEPGTLRETDPEEPTWMGKEVKGFRFRGQLKTGAAVEGEAYAVTFRGLAYWFLAWTAENEVYQEQKAAFADARRRCSLLDLRKDWKEKQSPFVAFKNNVLGYTILDAQGIWKEQSAQQLAGEGPEADKFLRAQLKRRGSDFTDDAELTVYVLPTAGEPLEVARAHVEAMANANRELQGKTTFADFSEPLAGDPIPEADGPAPILLLTSTNERDPNQARFWVISAIKVKDKDGEKVVAVCGRCLARDRATFDTRLVQIAKSLQAGGG